MHTAKWETKGMQSLVGGTEGGGGGGAEEIHINVRMRRGRERVTLTTYSARCVVTCGQ